MSFDAVLIPGGGLDADGKPAPWARARLDAALAVPGGPLLIALSAGTTHKPPRLDAGGFPLTESAAGAAYLVARGSPAARILQDTWSLDTIGNAYFARVAHAEPAGLRRLLVITSAFHMPRTRRIFEWVFGLPPLRAPFELVFEAVPDTGLYAEALAARIEKEAGAMAGLDRTIPRVTSLPRLHRFLFLEHDAYRAAAGRSAAGDRRWLETY